MIVYAQTPWFGRPRWIILALDETLARGDPHDVAKLFARLRDAALVGGVSLSEPSADHGASYWRDIGKFYEDTYEGAPRDPTPWFTTDRMEDAVHGPNLTRST